jgi:hypothetical protein
MTRLADEAFEPIYSNIENGLLKGTSSTNQATVPQGVWARQLFLYQV